LNTRSGSWMKLDSGTSFTAFLIQSKRLMLYCSVFGFLLGGFLFAFGNQDFFLWINKHCTDKIGSAAIVFSLFGEWFGMVLLLIASLFISFRKTFGVAFTWLSGACFSWFFKLWLLNGLARPSLFYFGTNVKLQFVEGIDIFSYNTFPSGHTITAFSSLILFRYVFPTLKSWQEFLLFFVAAFCGLSRIILVQHWPSDVLGGMILGLMAGFTGVWIAGKLPQSGFFEKSLLKR